MPQARNVGKLIVGDIIGGVATAPVFWYTRGLIDAASYALRFVGSRYETLGIGVWARNLFVPMFGQRDVTGTLISFFLRLFQVIVRSIVLLLWIAVTILVFAAYVFAPAYIVFEFFRQLAGLFFA
jgi:hypothetical protein